jgi:predicted dithiol-disulfide oxidoreductase (DUF899 family)
LPGCTYLTDNVTALERLADSGIAWATVSDMPLKQMAGYGRDRGRDVPYFSSRGTTFSVDCGARSASPALCG